MLGERSRNRSDAPGALAAVLALGLLAGVACAQTAGDVRAVLEQTDRLILRAETLLSGGGDELAREYLEQAKQFRSRAGNALDARLHRVAFRLAETARRRAAAAMDLSLRPGDREVPGPALERTDRLLQRVAPVVRECVNEAAERALAAALDGQDRARAALRLGRPRVALSLTARARGEALGSLRLAEDACGQGADRVQRAVENSAELLRESAWLRRTGGAAADFYGAALEANARAGEEMAAGHLAEALRLTLRARDQLVRALNLADRPPVRDAVVDAVRRSRERLQAAAARAASEGERGAVAEARRHQRRAEGLLEQGRLAGSLAEAGAVGSLLDRAGL